MVHDSMVGFSVVWIFLFIGRAQTDTFVGVDFPGFCKQTCSASCQTEFQATSTHFCNCDEPCPRFGDCCIGYFETCLNLQTDNDIISFLYDIKRNLQSPRVSYNDVGRAAKYSTCMTLHATEVISIYMISKCPVEFNNDIVRDKCEGNAYPFDDPVTNRWNLYEIFSSIFCAMCHNIPRRDMVVWNSTLRCPDSTQPITMDFITSRPPPFTVCRTRVEYHTSSKIRRCNTEEPAASCDTNSTGYGSLSSRELNLLCHSYITSVADGSSRVYRNPHCMACSTNRTFTEELRCYLHYVSAGGIPGNIIEYSKNISPMDMSYIFYSQSGAIVSEPILCYDNQTGNGILKTCEDRVCSNSTLIRDECFYVKNVQNSFENKNLILKLQLDTTEETPDLSRVFQGIRSSMTMAIINTGDKHGLHVNNRSIRIVYAALTPLKTNMSDFVYKIDFEVDIDSMLSDAIRLLHIALLQYRHTDSIDVTLGKMVMSNVHDIDTVECSAGEKTVFKNMPVVESGGKLYGMFAKSSMLVDLEQGVYSVLLSHHYGVLHLQEFVLCLSEAENTYLNHPTKSRLDDCQTVAFTESEYKLTEHDQLKLNKNGHVISKGQYIIKGDVAHVCTDVLKSLLATVQADHMAHGTRLYKTISLAIALACVSLSLCTKLIQKDYEEKHNKFQLCLISCLIIAFALDLLEHEPDSLTGLSVSALQHFVWLLVFMTHMLHVFCLLEKALNLFKDTKTKPRWLLLLIGCILIALIVVVVCLVLEKEHSTLYVGYGQGRVVRWMGSWQAQLVSYVLPVGVMSLTTSACLGYTLWYCWRLSHRYDSLKGRLCCRCQNDVLLTLLLVLLASCGVSAEYTRINALEELYYTMHIVMAFFLVHTLVVTNMVIHPCTLSTGREAANFDAIPSGRTSPDLTHAQVFTIPTGKTVSE
ncbi:uncharacterized protein LOC124118804 [Haliotis rufescens]|uniref:uncharacterized protein LOC124118804 n=1 Tax=Haliotis rufescens TaxID=6454 RepID=UPI00201EF759|nr:uncharacterized protein LOC124118804 [Haliotis rufescens]